MARSALCPLCLVSALLVPACTFHKGDDETREDAAPSRPPATVDAAQAAPVHAVYTVHSDVEGLRRYLQLPEGVTHCRWITQAKGDAAQGPSDSILTAFVELSPAGWNESSCDGGAPGAPRKMEVDAAEARSLLPGRVVVSLAGTAGDKLLVPSTQLAAGCVHAASALDVSSVDRVGNGLWIVASAR
jgi:hypothetical protein